MNKHKSEEGWALILLRYLNTNGCDYEIGENYTLPAHWADVDVFAKSASGKYLPLYIQLCLDVEPKNEGYVEIRKKPKVYTFNNFGETPEAIKGKVEKYEKQKKDYSQITLAIQTDLIQDDEIYHVPRLREECKQYNFKAIYLLSPHGEIYGPPAEEVPELVFQIH